MADEHARNGYQGALQSVTTGEILWRCRHVHFNDNEALSCAEQSTSSSIDRITCIEVTPSTWRWWEGRSDLMGQRSKEEIEEMHRTGKYPPGESIPRKKPPFLQRLKAAWKHFWLGEL